MLFDITNTNKSKIQNITIQVFNELDNKYKNRIKYN